MEPCVSHMEVAMIIARAQRWSRETSANIDDNPPYPWFCLLGPHPFPRNCSWLPKCYRSRSFKQQYCDLLGQDLPDALVVCGSNAVSLFHPFVEDESVAMGGRIRWIWASRSYLWPRVAQEFFTVLSWMFSKMPIWTNLRSLLYLSRLWTFTHGYRVLNTHSPRYQQDLCSCDR